VTIETPAVRIHACLAGLSNAQTSAIDEGRYPHAHNLAGNAVKKLLLVLLAIWLGFAAAGSVIGTVKFGGGVGSLVAVTPPIPTSLGRARLLAVILHRPERSVGIDFHVLHVHGNSLRADSPWPQAGGQGT
jgi:hypothetical protein